MEAERFALERAAKRQKWTATILPTIFVDLSLPARAEVTKRPQLGKDAMRFAAGVEVAIADSTDDLMP